MTESITPLTTHFGFTRINAGEAFSKNGWALTDADRVRIDDLLFALATHTHTGEPPLGDPTDPPTFNTVSTGGHLPAATPFFYRVSFIDRFGLETAASPEGSVVTPNPIAPPPAPSAAVETSSGTVAPGIYSYLCTYFDAYGGETTPSSLNNVQVTSGADNRIRLDFGDLPDGVVGIRIYRSRPGQSQFYYLDASSGSSFYDEGTAEDQTVTVPTVNTTNSANSIEVTIPLAFIPLGCVAWRIYRASESGAYDGNSLVHEVIEGVTDTSVVPRTVWTDTGDTLLPGFPQETGTTIGDGTLLTLNELSGALPLTVIPRGTRCLSFQASGNITDGETVFVTDSPTAVKPVRFTAFFKTPPSTGTTVTFRASDGTNHVDLVCPDAPASGDPAGYYHASWPLAEALERFMTEAAWVSVSDVTQVGLITDEVSSTGQSMLLDTQNEWCQANMDTLEAGVYSAFASLRTNEGTTTASDIRVDVIRLDTNAVVATQLYTVATGIGFADTAGLSFTAPGNCQIAIRVTKATTAAQTYEVQDVRYTTTVPSLSAGRLTVSALVGSGPTTAADAAVALWV